MDNGDSGPGAQWMAPDLHEKMQKSRHIVLSFDGARRESGLGAAAWILWLPDDCGIFEKVSYGGRVLRNASAMIAEREALRMGIEYWTVEFPMEVSSFDFEVECTDRTVQYKLNAQSLRLFGLHRDVNDAHRAGANRLQKRKTNWIEIGWFACSGILWDLIVFFFEAWSQISDRTRRPVNVDVKRNQKSQGKINVMEIFDSVPSNVQPSHQEALLYVFEDNEAVIRIIIKGRSPTMRHVSRTHRVALDWLFDRINLDPKIQIKYIDTKKRTR